MRGAEEGGRSRTEGGGRAAEVPAGRLVAGRLVAAKLGTERQGRELFSGDRCSIQSEYGGREL